MAHILVCKVISIKDDDKAGFGGRGRLWLHRRIRAHVSKAKNAIQVAELFADLPVRVAAGPSKAGRKPAASRSATGRKPGLRDEVCDVDSVMESGP